MLTRRGLHYQRTVVGPDVEIQGDLISQGLVEVHGIVKGNLCVKGKVVICEEANCISNIAADFIEIAGRVHGDVRADKLVLYPTGRLYGKAICHRQVIRRGGAIMPTGSGLVREAPALADPNACAAVLMKARQIDIIPAVTRAEVKSDAPDISVAQQTRQSQGDRQTAVETTIERSAERSARPEGVRGPVFRPIQPKQQSFIVSF
ncbi:MAG TPA: polymer-forming cytoskeletal protein [Clostridia bacterium]|nr:polymer-forming cytoskeletal protein [Clostridia bacterium]